MAATSRSKSLYKSMLPTIKCSSCGNDIEISMMGEHMCDSSEDAVTSNPYTNRSDHERIPSTPSIPSLPPHEYMEPKRSDVTHQHSGEQEHEFEQEHPFNNNHHSLDYAQQAESHIEYEDGYETGDEHEHEHDTAGLPPPRFNSIATHSFSRPMRPKPPSVDPVAANNLMVAHARQDPLMTASSIGASEREPLTSANDSASGGYEFPFRSEPGTASLNVPPTPSYAPLSPRIAGSEDVLKRMNSIVSGPFSAGRKPSDTGSALLGAERPEPRRMKSSEIIGIRTEGAASPFDLPEFSPASHISHTSPLPSPLSITDPMQLPLGPPPPRPNRPEHVDGLMDALAEAGKEALIDPSQVKPHTIIKAVPEQDPKTVDLPDMLSRSPRSPAFDNQPNNYLLAHNERPASRFSQMLPESSFETSLPEKTTQPGPGLTRKLTNLLRSKSQRRGRRRNDTNDSASSSNESKNGDSGTSYTSSPPTSNASSFSPVKQSQYDFTSFSNNNMSGHIPRKPSTESNTSSGSTTANFSRPRPPEPLDPVIEIPDRTDSQSKVLPSIQIPERNVSYFHNRLPTPVDSPMDPALLDGSFGQDEKTHDFNLSEQNDDLNASNPPDTLNTPEHVEQFDGANEGSHLNEAEHVEDLTEYHVAEHSPPLSPPDPAVLPKRNHSLRQPRLPDVNPVMPKPKGTCRGCSQPIYGKAVKAADGRLTGRYHRSCFVCRTCRRPFATADFYVIKNQPYCAHHYHVLNHTLCYTCNQGIEGTFAETQEPNPRRRRKYHSECFRCLDCSCSLDGDYFEINGRFYCEKDAMRVHYESSLLTPGKRFPERRRTKLMMM